MRQLETVGISVHRSLSVTPVGLMARHWTADGTGEYLTTETPCFSVELDHEIDRLSVQVNHDPKRVIECRGTKRVFIAIDPLPTGLHRVSLETPNAIDTSTIDGGAASAGCVIELRVRAPSEWIAGSLCHDALIVDVHPSSPSLKQFLAGDVDVHIEGSRSHRVACHLILSGANGQQVASHKLLEGLLPVTTTTWQQAVTAFLKPRVDDLDLISSTGAYLLIESRDFGNYRVPLVTSASPLRWALHKLKRTSELRLIDEGLDDPVEVRFSAFSRPFEAKVLARDAAEQGVDLSAFQGLFEAISGELEACVVVDTMGTGTSLQWMNVTFDDAHIGNVKDIAVILGSYRRWYKARPSNMLARFRTAQVLKALRKHLITVVCGSDWCRAESKFEDQVSGVTWGRLQALVDPINGADFATSLLRSMPEHRTEHFDALLEEHFRHTCSNNHVVDERLASYAWQFALIPQALATAEPLLPEHAARNSLIVAIRGARLLFLARRWYQTP